MGGSAAFITSGNRRYAKQNVKPFHLLKLRLIGEPMKTPVALAFILCAVVCTAGCFLLDERPAATVTPTAVPTTTAATPTVTSLSSSRDPAAIALQLSDLPAGYIIRERADTPYSDSTMAERQLGWEKGYQASFYRMDLDKIDLTSVTQRIALYHVDNVNLLDSNMKIVFDEAQSGLLALANDTVSVTELPFPKTGENTAAYRISNVNSTYRIVQYDVIFTRKDVLEGIEMKGTTTDYELLKVLAAEAAAKIT